MGFYGYGMGGYLLVEGQCGVVERKCNFRLAEGLSEADLSSLGAAFLMVFSYLILQISLYFLLQFR